MSREFLAGAIACMRDFAEAKWKRIALSFFTAHLIRIVATPALVDSRSLGAYYFSCYFYSRTQATIDGTIIMSQSDGAPRAAPAYPMT
jgi:hypothetical protein